MSSQPNRELLIPSQLDHLLEASRFLNMFSLTKMHFNNTTKAKQQQQQKEEARNDDEKQQHQKEENNNNLVSHNSTKRPRILDIPYSTLNTILQFLGSVLSFKSQNLWGAGGSSWGGCPDLILIERPTLSNFTVSGIQIRLQVWCGGTVQTAKFVSVENERNIPNQGESDKQQFQCCYYQFAFKDKSSAASDRFPLAETQTCGRLLWTKEPGATRGAKPLNGYVNFKWDPQRSKDLSSELLAKMHTNAPPPKIAGYHQHSGEGKIDLFGRMRVYDWEKKMNPEVPGSNSVPLRPIHDAKNIPLKRNTWWESLEEYP